MKINISSAALRRKYQQGLTLIELLVVLVIVVAVAGILVPLFPDVRQQAHGATGGDNMKEIAKALELHKASTGNYPNGWDSLIDVNDELAADTDLRSLDLTAGVGPDVLIALTEAGITEAFKHTDFIDLTGVVNQTFEGVSAINGISGNEVAELTSTGIGNLGLEPTGGDGPLAYVAFGLGQTSTAIGQSMLDAPVHTLESGESPFENYARWIVVFAVPAEGSIRLASVCAAEDRDELAGLNAHLGEYYEAIK